MGEIDGMKGMWAHVKGGMGALSDAIAMAALEAGATIATDSPVKSIDVANGVARSVTLEDGIVLTADKILSNATPAQTMVELVGRDELPNDVYQHFKKTWSCDSASTKVWNPFQSLWGSMP